MKNRSSEDFLESKFSKEMPHYNEPPEFDAWQDISRELDRRKQREIYRYRYAAIALIVLLGTTTALLLPEYTTALLWRPAKYAHQEDTGQVGLDEVHGQMFPKSRYPALEDAQVPGRAEEAHGPSLTNVEPTYMFRDSNGEWKEKDDAVNHGNTPQYRATESGGASMEKKNGTRSEDRKLQDYREPSHLASDRKPERKQRLGKTALPKDSGTGQKTVPVADGNTLSGIPSSGKGAIEPTTTNVQKQKTRYPYTKPERNRERVASDQSAVPLLWDKSGTKASPTGVTTGLGLVDGENVEGKETTTVMGESMDDRTETLFANRAVAKERQGMNRHGEEPSFPKTSEASEISEESTFHDIIIRQGNDTPNATLTKNGNISTRAKDAKITESKSEGSKRETATDTHEGPLPLETMASTPVPDQHAKEETMPDARWAGTADIPSKEAQGTLPIGENRKATASTDSEEVVTLPKNERDILKVPHGKAVQRSKQESGRLQATPSPASSEVQTDSAIKGKTGTLNRLPPEEWDRASEASHGAVAGNGGSSPISAPKKAKDNTKVIPQKAKRTNQGPLVADTVEEKMAKIEKPEKEEETIPKGLRERDEKGETEETGWAIGLTVGPRYLFKRLNPEEDLIYLKRLNNKNEISRRNSSFSAQVYLEKKLGDKLSLFGKLSYTAYNSYVEYTYSNILSDRLEVKRTDKYSLEVVGFSEDQDNRMESRSRALGISVGGTYILSDIGHVQRLGLGASVGHLKQDRFTTGVEGHLLENAPYTLSVDLHWEHLYSLSAGWQLSAGPYVSYSLNSFYNKSSVYGFRPFLIGLNLGLRKGLRKKQRK